MSIRWLKYGRGLSFAWEHENNGGSLTVFFWPGLPLWRGTKDHGNGMWTRHRCVDLKIIAFDLYDWGFPTSTLRVGIHE